LWKLQKKEVKNRAFVGLEKFSFNVHENVFSGVFAFLGGVLSLLGKHEIVVEEKEDLREEEEGLQKERKSSFSGDTLESLDRIMRHSTS
jgi:hypothetical protein